MPDVEPSKPLKQSMPNRKFFVGVDSDGSTPSNSEKKRAAKFHSYLT